jgi:septal ring factor EnvC (AmiA/AmiB activator)
MCNNFFITTKMHDIVPYIASLILYIMGLVFISANYSVNVKLIDQELSEVRDEYSEAKESLEQEQKLNKVFQEGIEELERVKEELEEKLKKRDEEIQSLNEKISKIIKTTEELKEEAEMPHLIPI